MRPLQCVGDDPLCFRDIGLFRFLIDGTVHHGILKEVLKVGTHGLSERDNGG